ncbi:hypothetical protein B566_EDAN016642 [Ephemera danica]|nr:hypothetical protein B566_EDAN016642 [Ephemera danica]
MEERELPSESEESDEDYVPSGEEGKGSEEESDGDAEDQPEPGSGDEAKIASKARKRKGNSTKKNAKKRARTVSPPVDGEEEEEPPGQNEEQLKKKADDLWADFQKDTPKPSKPPEKSTVVTDKTAAQTLTTIYEFAGEKVEIPVKNANSFGKSRLSKSGSGISWSAMLNKRKPTIPLSRVPVKAATVPDKTPAVPSKTPEIPTKTPAVPSTARGAPARGIPSRAGSGLASMLGQLGKKNKLSTLEKSKLDWEGYKEQNGLTEEIQTHNKGKHGYLEKQDFLQRTDLRQFEREKQMRSNTRRSNR